MKTLTACLPFVAVAGLLGGPASAQPAPSPDQAKALQAQIQATLQSTLGGLFKLPDPALQLTAEGDHYLLRMPVAPFVRQADPADAAITAKVRQLDGTRWAFEDARYPSDFKMTVLEPAPPDTSSPTPPGKPPAVKPDNLVSYQFKLGEQEGHGVFDTAGAAVSSSSGTIASLDMIKTGGMGASLTHTGRLTSQTSTRPIDPAHMDLVSDLAVEAYASKFELPDGTAGEVTAERLHVSTTMSGLAREQIAALGRMALDAMAAAKGPGRSQDLTPADKARLHAMLVTARGLLTGAHVEEAADGLKFDAGGHKGALGKFAITFGGDAPQDMLSASLGFTLDGLVIDELPPEMAGYVPTHFTIRPTVSNISLADLTKMGLAATAPPPAKGQPAPGMPDFQTLFAHGGVNFGFDTFALDVAGAQFGGTGSLTMTGMDAMHGTAEITASGVDTLIARAQADPMVAQAVPVLIFAKGIAKTTGDRAVWQITLNGKKLLVNGVDLSAMAGGMK